MVHVINSLGFGGAERQLSVLFPAFAAKGIHQGVIPLVDAHAGVDLPADAVLRPEGRFQLVRSLLSAVACARCPGVTLVAWMYHSWVVAFVAYLLTGRKCQLFFYCRHGDPATLNPTTRLLAIAMLRVARALRILVVFNSRASASMHESLVPGILRATVANAIPMPDVEKVRRTRVVAFLGRNHVDKGADRVGMVIGRVLAVLPASWRGAIAGPGMCNRASDVRRAAQANGVDPSCITVADAIGDVGAFLLESDVLVLPSRTESFPNVVAEAMALGVPVAALDVGGVREVVGEVFEPAETIDDLVRATASICLADDDEYFELCRAARREIHAHFGLASVAAAHIAIWRG